MRWQTSHKMPPKPLLKASAKRPRYVQAMDFDPSTYQEWGFPQKQDLGRDGQVDICRVNAGISLQVVQHILLLPMLYLV